MEKGKGGRGERERGMRIAVQGGGDWRPCLGRFYVSAKRHVKMRHISQNIAQSLIVVNLF